jgi:hypothetical protein
MKPHLTLEKCTYPCFTKNMNIVGFKKLWTIYVLLSKKFGENMEFTIYKDFVYEK